MLTVKIVSKNKTIWSNVETVVLPDVRVEAAVFKFRVADDDDFVKFDMVKMKIREISVYNSGILVDYIKAEDDDCEQFYNFDTDMNSVQERLMAAQDEVQAADTR